MTPFVVIRLPWQHRPLVAVDPAHVDIPTVPSGLARVWILTATSEREVELRLTAERVSDSLNDRPGAWVRDMSDSQDGGAWSLIPADELLIVVPPDHATDRTHRLHRIAREVRVVVPPFEVVGRAHVQPGSDPAAYLYRHGRTFVALTHASLLRGGDDLGLLPAVIVNLRAATRITPVADGDGLTPRTVATT